MDGDGDVGDADHAPADHHDDHRDDGFPGTTEDSGGTVGEGQQEIEEGRAWVVPYWMTSGVRLKAEII